jgi:VIT1/CCC1 family predicted Fe2+/Mn2+ transporter
MENESPQQKSLLESVSFYIFLALAFLLPLFFLKGSILQFSKSILASLAVLLVLLVWSIAKLKQGRVTLYLNWISWGGLAVGLSSLLSSIF